MPPTSSPDDTRIVFRACPLCEATCGITVQVANNRAVAVKGDADDPLSRGYLCPKAHGLIGLQDDPDRLDQALRLLARLLAIAEQAGAAYFVVRFLVLQAVALAHNQAGQARAALARALDIAEPQAYIRIFVDEREQIGSLLLPVLAYRQQPQQTALKDTAPGYVDRLLSALREEPSGLSPQTTEPQPSLLVEPLSERECEVLRLVAAGLSNREIAQVLVIALNTVKNHLKNVYGKLAVHSRTQAVERARTLDLL